MFSSNRAQVSCMKCFSQTGFHTARHSRTAFYEPVNVPVKVLGNTRINNRWKVVRYTNDQRKCPSFRNNRNSTSIALKSTAKSGLCGTPVAICSAAAPLERRGDVENKKLINCVISANAIR